MKICFVADNRNRANWGCRATSIALKELVQKENEIVSTIYGDITFYYNRVCYEGTHPQLSKYTRIIRKIPYLRRLRRKDEADFITGCTKDSLNKFLSIFYKYAPLRDIYSKIEKCDSVVLNGEGTFIFTTPHRYDTAFYLFVLTLAQYLKKKTFVVNAMFSPAPDGSINQEMLIETRDVFRHCDKIQARDPLSFDFCKKYLSANVNYVPDALFSWKYLQQYKPLCIDYPLSGIMFPETEEQWEEKSFKQYVCVSGGSLVAKNQVVALECYKRLVNQLKDAFGNVILVATCDGDHFLYDVSKQTQTPVIDVRTNILFGASVLANALVFISGRWHPSILASLGGTPCILTSSNSHKTLALQYMLEYEEPHEYSCSFLDSEISDIISEAKRYIEQGQEKRNIISEKASSLGNLVIDNFKLY